MKQAMVQALSAMHTQWHTQWLRQWPLLLAVVCLLVALWTPTIALQRPVHRYLVTLDLSQSMWVADATLQGTPVTRMTMAKAAAASLLSGLPCGSEVGWSVFAERRTVTLITPVEVCEHYEALLGSLEGIDQRMRWGEASGIGKGLHQTLRAADAAGPDTAVVLITDGHEAPPLGPGQSGFPKRENLAITGMLAGVGGDQPVPIPRINDAGETIGYWQPDEVVQNPDVPTSQEHLSWLHEPHLQSLARLAGLGYVRIESPENLLAALRQSPPGNTDARPVDLRWIPATLALLALLWHFRPALARRRLRNASILSDARI